MQIHELDPNKLYIVSVSDRLDQEDVAAVKAKLTEFGIKALVVADVETEQNIGQPAKSASAWLRDFASENETAASSAFWPWSRVKYRARAAAFREALRLVWSAS